jgi:hypothetical protein
MVYETWYMPGRCQDTYKKECVLNRLSGAGAISNRKGFALALVLRFLSLVEP